VVLLSSPLLTIKTGSAVRVSSLAIAYSLAMATISPVIAAIIHREGVKEYGDQYRLIARALENAWREQTDRPLRNVASFYNLANGIDFYLPGQPVTLDIFRSPTAPWADRHRIEQEGAVFVCPELLTSCLSTVNLYVAQQAGVTKKTVVLARSYLGVPGAPVSYRFITVPPQASNVHPTGIVPLDTKP